MAYRTIIKASNAVGSSLVNCDRESFLNERAIDFDRRLAFSECGSIELAVLELHRLNFGLLTAFTINQDRLTLTLEFAILEQDLARAPYVQTL